MKRLALAILLACALPGCAIFTVAPTQVHATVASFDGNDQNSGLVSINKQGAVVTPNFIARYQALVKTFGQQLDPPAALAPLKGVDPVRADGNYHVTLEVISNFATMNRWHRDADAKKDAEKPGFLKSLL